MTSPCPRADVCPFYKRGFPCCGDTDEPHDGDMPPEVREPFECTGAFVRKDDEARWMGLADKDGSEAERALALLRRLAANIPEEGDQAQ